MHSALSGGADHTLLAFTPKEMQRSVQAAHRATVTWSTSVTFGIMKPDFKTMTCHSASIAASAVGNTRAVNLVKLYILPVVAENNHIQLQSIGSALWNKNLSSFLPSLTVAALF